MGTITKIQNSHDVKQLRVGDQLLDRPVVAEARKFVIENIAHGVLYAIHHNGGRELRLLFTGEAPAGDWWVYKINRNSSPEVSRNEATDAQRRGELMY